MSLATDPGMELPAGEKKVGFFRNLPRLLVAEMLEGEVGRRAVLKSRKLGEVAPKTDVIHCRVLGPIKDMDDVTQVRG